MIKDSKKIKVISYEEMLEMSSLGAKVMQPISIQDARLNRIDINVKSSFKNKPVPFICANQPFTYNHGAKDPEGDQLSYSLIAPMTAPASNSCNSNGTVNYLAGYNAQQPILSTPPVTVDPVTGDVVMNPTQQEV